MEKEILLENLISSVREKLSGRLNLADALADLLMIGKEAAYRRIRGEVSFSFDEVATIARHYRISLDHLVGLSAGANSVFNLVKIRYLDPGPDDYLMAEHILSSLKEIVRQPDCELATTTNSLPFYMLVDYPGISKFLMYKWMYRHEKGEYEVPFAEVEIPEKLFTIFRKICEELKNIKKTTLIWDPAIMKYLVDDLLYFESLEIITDSVIAVIKGELMSMIDRIEDISIRGHYDTGNRVDVYISNTYFDTTYGYLCSSTTSMSMIRAFILNLIVSHDPRIMEEMKNWIEALKRQSMLISETGEMHRIKFLTNQRATINQL